MKETDEGDFSEEFLEWVGLKKSEYLSWLITELGSDDFGFETFHKYDHLIASTLERPDEIWYSKAEDFPLQFYHKFYSQENLIQIVVMAMEKNRPQGIPILSVVTKFQKIASFFKQGQRSEGSLLQ
jgi:hypothetical protein